jgi:hypothetical protein
MKYKILIALLLVAFISQSCEKDESVKNDTPSGKLYVRSLLSLVTGIVSIDWYYLGNDGVLVKNPKNGVQPVDINAEKQNNLANTGTYRMYEKDGKSFIEITWSSGDKTTMSLKIENGIITEMDVMGIMVLQTGLSKGYTLNGTYTGLSTGLIFDFTTNGAFTLKDYNYETGQTETYSGTYTIDGNNLRLKQQDNSILNCLLTALDDATLIINREYYEKE